MRKIHLYLTIMVMMIMAQGAMAQTGTKPSGVYSINGQQTVGNNNIYYAPAEEYIDFVTSDNPQLPTEIQKWNGAVVDGVRIEHDRSFFQARAKDLQKTALTQLNLQLAAANAWSIENNYGAIFSKGKEDARTYKNYLKNNVSIMEVVYAENDTIYLLGERGEFTKGKFVFHKVANGKYYVLTTSTRLRFILARVSCWNNVDTYETLWLAQERATAKPIAVKQDDFEEGEDYTDAPIAKSPKKTVKAPKNVDEEESSSLDGEDSKLRASFIDSAGRTVNIYVQAAGGKGGNVVIGDVSGGNSYNINGGGSKGQDGKDGRDGRDGKNGQNTMIYGTGDNMPYPGYSNAPNIQNQERFLVVDGVHIDKSAAYFKSLGSPNYPMKGVVNGWRDWIFGNQCNSYAYYNNGQYCLGGNWNNGYFQPNYNQCYQWNGNGWSILGSVAAGFFNNLAFCGGYGYSNGPRASGPCWYGPTNNGWNQCNRNYYNNYYTNNPIPQGNNGGPHMGFSIPANANAVGNVVNGGPHMAYSVF